jgi:AcrR family transcriptional regulator
MATRLQAKGADTRRRILDAATEEFATYGIAGARVDRIVAVARTNKAQMYSYFGNKDQLFDVVFNLHVDRIVNAVPVDGADLPGYAVRLYDAYLEHPELVRLVTWARLERNPTGDLFGDGRDHDAGKLDNIAQAQRAGLITAGPAPVDVLALVTAMSMTWSPASALIAAGPDDTEEVHVRRREALAEAVRRAFEPVRQ